MNNPIFTKAEDAKIKFLGTLEQGEYIAEIYDDGECYNAYITKHRSGLKTSMFGLPKAQQSFEDALYIFMNSFDEYIDRYEDDVEAVEAAAYTKYMESLR